jgi:putative transposase
MVSKRILGVEVGKDTVTKSLGLIEDKALAWLERDFTEEYRALFIDGTNFRMQRRGSTEKEPSLVVIGLDHKNCMSILTVQPGHKDNAESWREVFADLSRRGLKTSSVRIGVMDGLPGLETAFRESFTNAVTGRCWVHSLRNALAKAPERLRVPFKRLAHQVMYASSENAARVAFKELKLAMQSDAQRAVHCIEKDLDSLLMHYRFDRNLWRSLRTTNPIERVNKELKRRTKSMESLGERTLMVIAAFTAMRLEYQWQRLELAPVAVRL